MARKKLAERPTGKPRLYAIKSFDRYVLRLTFSDSGVAVELTDDPRMAARVSVGDVAGHLASCFPGGFVKDVTDFVPVRLGGLANG